jgi:hypothetical protein
VRRPDRGRAIAFLYKWPEYGGRHAAWGVEWCGVGWCGVVRCGLVVWDGVGWGVSGGWGLGGVWLGGASGGWAVRGWVVSYTGSASKFAAPGAHG